MARTLYISKQHVRGLMGVGALNKQTGKDAIGAGVALAPVIAGALSSTATVASATGLAPMLTAIGVSGPLAPFVAAGIAVALPVFKLIKSMAAGCGETCIATSNWANQAAAALEDIKSKYFAQKVRTRSSQNYTLQIIDQIFEELRALCSKPETGDAGRRCISERLVRGVRAGYCDTANPPAPPGECNWLVFYRDPVANDTGVVEDAALDDSIFGSGAGSGAVSSMAVPLVLLGGAALVYAVGSD